MNWRSIFGDKRLKFLIFIFLFTTLSGALRKWVIDSAVFSNALLGVQLLIPVLFAFLKGAFKFSNTTTKFFNVIVVYLALLFLTAFNPLNHTFFHGLTGIVIHSGFFIGMFFYIKNKENFSLERLIPFFILICVSEIVLGAIQSQLPAESFINRYANQPESAVPDAYVGDAVRVTGTFSYISGYNSFLIFYTLLICALIKARYPVPLIFTMLIMGFYGTLISGSRGSFLIYIVTIGMYITFCTSLKSNSRLISYSILTFLAVSITNFAFNDPLNIAEKLSKSLNNFTERVETANEDNSSRAVGAITQLIRYDGPMPLTGVGLGAAYQGANALFGLNPLLYGIDFEAEPKRIVLEGGFILLFVKIFLLFYLIMHLNFSIAFKLYLVAIIILAIPIAYNIYNAFYMMIALMLLDRVHVSGFEKD